MAVLEYDNQLHQTLAVIALNINLAGLAAQLLCAVQHIMNPDQISKSDADLHRMIITTAPLCFWLSMVDNRRASFYFANCRHG